MNLQLTTYNLQPGIRRIFLLLVVGCLLLVSSSTAFAAPPTTAPTTKTPTTTKTALPTTCVEVPLPQFFSGSLPDPCSSPAAYIQYWFYLGLYLGGFIALLTIVIGGVYRVFFAYNPSGTSKANSYILNAVLGLILLFGSWLLLRTLGGPGLTTVQDPVLPHLPSPGYIAATPPIPGEGSTCVNTAQCTSVNPALKWCVNGTCHDGTTGDPCTGNTTCQSGTCTNKKCVEAIWSCDSTTGLSCYSKGQAACESGCGRSCTLYTGNTSACVGGVH